MLLPHGTSHRECFLSKAVTSVVMEGCRLSVSQRYVLVTNLVTSDLPLSRLCASVSPSAGSAGGWCAEAELHSELKSCSGDSCWAP